MTSKGTLLCPEKQAKQLHNFHIYIIFKINFLDLGFTIKQSLKLIKIFKKSI